MNCANLHSAALQFRVDPITQTSGDASTCGFAQRLRYPGKRNIGAFGNVYRPASKGRMMGKVLHFDTSDLGQHRWRILCPDQLGPDTVPVMGPEVPPHHMLVGGPLNRHAVLRTGKPLFITVLPLPDLGNVLDIDGCSQGGDAEGARGIEVSAEVHAPIVVANAIRMQAAFAMRSIDTLKRMTSDALKEHRITRLQALIDERFSEAPANLAAQLNLKNAAFIRQLLSGHRPITEKTIAKIEALPGAAGWFGDAVATDDGEPFVLTAEERDVILTLRARKAARGGAFNVTGLTPHPGGEMRSVTRPGSKMAPKAGKQRRGT